VIAGCSTGTTSTSSDLVTQAVTTATLTHDQIKQCYDDFDSCIAAAGTDATAIDACKTTLQGCLPTPPDPPPVPNLCADADGGVKPPHGDCNGGGGPGQPPPPPPDGGPGGGPGGHGGPGGPGGPGVPPGPPLSPAGHLAVATCHAQLKACLAAGADKDTCVSTAHQCVHDALAADFAQLCSDAATACAACATPSDLCTKIAAQCAAGLPLPPDQKP
jgi:hypothetical protein